MSNTTNTDPLNMSRQNPFRTGIQQQRKKKAHALVQKVSQKSKTIQRGQDYQAKLKRKSKKMSLKKRAARGESAKAVAQLKAITSKKLRNRDKRKLNKTLWETTHDQIQKEDITDGDEDSDFEDMEESSGEEAGEGGEGGEGQDDEME